MERYLRHMNFPHIGTEGQKRLLGSSVLVIGAGGLGTNFASHFARAGVGRLLIVDRDKVELTNLQRQWLYDEDDLGSFKAQAALNKLRKINSSISIDAVVDEVGPHNIDDLVHGFDLVVDATDNLSTRILIDKACEGQGIPWVFTGVLGAEGQTMAVVPGKTKGLEDLLGKTTSKTASNMLEPDEQSSVLAPAISIISSVAVIICFKLLLGQEEEVLNKLYVMNAWDARLRSVQL